MVRNRLGAASLMSDGMHVLLLLVLLLVGLAPARLWLLMLLLLLTNVFRIVCSAPLLLL